MFYDRGAQIASALSRLDINEYAEAPNISSIITSILGSVRKIAKRMEQLGCYGTDFYESGYPLHSPVFPSVPLPCVTVCHHISTGR
jgi:hypothetical protein